MTMANKLGARSGSARASNSRSAPSSALNSLSATMSVMAQIGLLLAQLGEVAHDLDPSEAHRPEIYFQDPTKQMIFRDYDSLQMP